MGVTKAERVEETVGVLGWRLREEDVELLDRVAEGTGVKFEGAGFQRTTGKFIGYGWESWPVIK